MTEQQVKLLFSVLVEIDPAYSDELGNDLSNFLQESFFNGEDVCDVEYIGQKIMLNKN
ncbi:MAG: hypothetical protein UHM08_08705 [Bacteroidales bacterium]|nr:hypothetical protein [Bacteroidales bacterium]